MEFHYTITPDPGRMIGKIAGDVLKARRAGMIKAVTTIEALAVKKAPVRTSNLANSATNDVSDDGLRGIVRFTAPYAEFVHQGTGLFGPHKTRIIPKAKQALYWPGATHPVRSVKGMKGTPFLTDAVAEVNPSALYQEGVNDHLQSMGV